MTTMTMDSLKKESLRVYDSMIAVFPQFGEEEALNMSYLMPKFNACYASNNSTVCFIDKEGVFVTPYTRKAMKCLHDAGFTRCYFYVPFSNGDYPKAEKRRWKELREKANRSYHEDFVSDSEKYCDEHGIGAIEQKLLENCFVIPATGVHVTHIYYETVYYPVMCESCLDCRCTNLGTYNYNNGRVVFVYRDGHTYVTKGYGIIKALQEAGFKESSLFVPFSNGEVIQDPDLKIRWEAIRK